MTPFFIEALAYVHLYLTESDDEATAAVVEAPAMAKEDAFEALPLYLSESLLELLYRFDELDVLLGLYLLELDEYPVPIRQVLLADMQLLPQGIPFLQFLAEAGKEKDKLKIATDTDVKIIFLTRPMLSP
ncbi:hypothetical protein MNY66_06340 [Moellerella wisconsensis]|uniref:Uncharacterized protein n=1 Tax=Moellerella wisconsensis TaxID=158849 RepID=A0ACD3YC45_9GAMM|nr:hypothetical protein [Moellerella wisconsensis]UNH25256.1 hypothetical protein MNY68_05915 [Moellerella wisconsensis]UNH28414.1 hypothetical protein MNY64_06385 [Moellerella wisconsensis]UNH40004.1 hypothetical protein MNY70_06065 [Moellerella wisconsensis]UNH43586.1 hypothetical protein MNY66_06340 [Moellerella wisconsensis]